jgi:hypothetical protein
MGERKEYAPAKFYIHDLFRHFAMKYMRTCVQHSFSLDSTGQHPFAQAAIVYGQSGPLFHFKLPEQWDCSETGRLVKMR